MIMGIRSILPLEKLLLGFIAGFVLLGGLDTLNDYYDLEVDKISKPWRPLPRGAVAPRIALIVSIIEIPVGVSIAIFFGIRVLIVCLLGVGLAIAYSLWLKPFLLAKNLVVLISLTIASITGLVAVTSAPILDYTVGIVLVLILSVAFAFEVHKDLGDIDGDLSKGIRTIPTEIGLRKSIFLISICYGLALVIAFSLT